MTKKPLHPFQNQVILLAGEMAEQFSFNRSLGQIFGFLFINADPISLEEIASSCRMSKANASLHLRTLEAWGAVRKSLVQGTRKDYYTAADDLQALALRRLQEGLVKRLEHAKHRLKALKDDPACGELLKQSNGAPWVKRLSEIESLVDKVESGVGYLPKLAQLRRFL